MDAALRKLGFEVRTLRNLDLPHMEAAIDEFTAGLSAGSLAFFYYSGHGLQVNYANYLLPVDFAASSEIDVKYKAYPASRVQEKMEASGARLRVLVLDACRNNPFRFRRDAVEGLASMPVNAEGTLIAFATGDNNTADDNQAEANGLYTKYLIPALQAPGLQLREAFQKAKEDVFVASKKAQNPSIYENIVGAYYLISAPSAPMGGTQPVRLDAASETWALIRNSTNPEDFESFAQAFPASDLASGARIRAAQLRRSSAATARPADAPPVQTGLPPATSAEPCPPAAQLYADAGRNRVDKYDLALREYADFLRCYPNLHVAPFAQYYIGSIHAVRGDNETAVHDFDVFLEKYPDNSKTPDAMYSKGVALIRLGRMTDGANEFAELIRRFPGNDLAIKACDQRKAMGLNCGVARKMKK